jgi:heptosyltransferase-2
MKPHANLIIQTAFLGDLLLSIPLLKRARALWPDSRLILVCRQGLGDFFTHTRLVDEVLEIKKGDAESYRQVHAALAGQEIDFLISPHESWRTAFFVRGFKAKHKIGFRRFMKGLFFDELVTRDPQLPDALRQLDLLSGQDADLAKKMQDYRQKGQPYRVQEQGLLTAPPAWASMSLKGSVDDSAFAQLQKKLSLDKVDFPKTVLLFPGSVWATKRWTESGFVQTGHALQSQGYQILVMGGPGEEALAQRIAGQIPGSFCLAGKTSIYESVLLIERSALVIGNDSASSHLAALCETPLIVIFGPTVIRFGYRPWSASTYLQEYNSLSCRPCGKHGHQKCPTGTHECMKHIGATDVVQKALAILRSIPSH